MMAGGYIRGAVPMWVPLLLVVAIVGGIGFYYIYKALTAKVKFDCYQLWKPEQLFGIEANKTVVFKDSVEKTPIEGVNVYLFEKKPYYWRTLSYSNVTAILAGQTPVATSGADGKAVISFTTPENKTFTKVLYLVVTSPQYWTEEYEMSVKFTPSAIVETKDKATAIALCKELYKSPYDFLEVKMKNAVTGEPVGYTISLNPIGNVNVIAGTLGVPTDANHTFYEMKTSVQFSISRGYYRIDAIKIVPTGVFDPKNGVFEGIHRIEVEIVKGGKTLVGPVVIFDEAVEESPLRKDGYWKVDKLLGKEILELAPDEAITVKIKVVADTATTAVAGDGRLGPGEQILKIQLIPAHPVSTPTEAIISG